MGNLDTICAHMCLLAKGSFSSQSTQPEPYRNGHYSLEGGKLHRSLTSYPTSDKKIGTSRVRDYLQTILPYPANPFVAELEQIPAAGLKRLVCCFLSVQSPYKAAM